MGIVDAAMSTIQQSFVLWPAYADILLPTALPFIKTPLLKKGELLNGHATN